MTLKNPPSLLVAGTHSGAGKTTAVFALMSLLAQKGFRVQPFKIGPDFIDGGYHRLAAGADSINLDPWMMGWKGVRESFREYSAGADVSVLEGMGALYDGRNGTTAGSSADIAGRLGVPVLLVVDIWGMTVTTGAVLEGLERFQPRVRIAGVLLNRAGSPAHFEMVRRSLRPAWRGKVVGYLPHSESFAVPERHLGLKTLEENKRARKVKAALLGAAGRTVDWVRLRRLMGIPGVRKVRSIPRSPVVEGSGGGFSPPNRVRLGVARDAAFCFYYAENLELLERAGAQLAFFSPLKDRKLPKELDGLYLGGGYPESFARVLSANRGLRAEILRKVGEGMPVYAECGGLMFLSRSLTDFDGRAFPMVSALPFRVRMDRRHLAIRYVELKTTRDTLLGPKGTPARGHEFHQSRIVSNRFRGGPAYRGRTSVGGVFTEGFQTGNLLASYLHLHFSSNPALAPAFTRKCREYQSGRKSPWFCR